RPTGPAATRTRTDVEARRASPGKRGGARGGRVGARLYTDFRYVEAARQAGADVVQTGRNIFVDLAERLSGRIAFEAETVTYAQYETLASGGLELVPRRRVVEQVRTVKDDGELAAIRRAAAITHDAFDPP